MARRRSTCLISCLVLAGAVLLGGPSATARDADPPLVPGMPVYLALGDSIANGQQSAPIMKDDYWSTVARWQAEGYVAQVHKFLVEDRDCVVGRGSPSGHKCRDLQLLNLARSAVPPEVDPPGGQPGVTTSILIKEQLPDAVALLGSRNHDADPSNDVLVVTITVGGNDIFGPITRACLPTPGPDCFTAIDTSFRGFAANYTQILATLRAAAGPDAQIVTMTYYNPLPYCAVGEADPAGAKMFGDVVLEGGALGGQKLEPGFNDLIDTISAGFGADVADPFGALGQGDFVGGGDCLHPDKSGHAKIAKAFEVALAGLGD